MLLARLGRSARPFLRHLYVDRYGKHLSVTILIEYLSLQQTGMYVWPMTRNDAIHTAILRRPVYSRITGHSGSSRGMVVLLSSERTELPER